MTETKVYTTAGGYMPHSDYTPQPTERCNGHWLMEAIAAGQVPTMAEINIAFTAAHTHQLRQLEDEAEGKGYYDLNEMKAVLELYWELEKRFSAAMAELNRRYPDEEHGPNLSWPQMLRWGQDYEREPRRHHYGLPVGFAVGSPDWLHAAVAAGNIPSWSCLVAALRAMRIFEEDYASRLPHGTDAQKATGVWHIEHVLEEIERSLGILQDVRDRLRNEQDLLGEVPPHVDPWDEL